MKNNLVLIAIVLVVAAISGLENGPHAALLVVIFFFNVIAPYVLLVSGRGIRGLVGVLLFVSAAYCFHSGSPEIFVLPILVMMTIGMAVFIRRKLSPSDHE